MRGVLDAEMDRARLRRSELQSSLKTLSETSCELGSNNQMSLPSISNITSSSYFIKNFVMRVDLNVMRCDGSGQKVLMALLIN